VAELVVGRLGEARVAAHRKLATHVAEIATLEPGGARLTDGAFVPADVVCSCIGFERNTGLCERLTGFNRVKGTNYLAPQVGGRHWALSIAFRERERGQCVTCRTTYGTCLAPFHFKSNG